MLLHAAYLLIGGSAEQALLLRQPGSTPPDPGPGQGGGGGGGLAHSLLMGARHELAGPTLQELQIGDMAIIQVIERSLVLGELQALLPPKLTASELTDNEALVRIIQSCILVGEVSGRLQ